MGLVTEPSQRDGSSALPLRWSGSQGSKDHQKLHQPGTVQEGVIRGKDFRSPTGRFTGLIPVSGKSLNMKSLIDFGYLVRRVRFWLSRSEKTLGHFASGTSDPTK